MRPTNDNEARKFIGDFFTQFTEQVVRGEDAAQAMDRFYTRDIVQISDGIRLDRERLLAHIRPVRKNLRSFRVEVFEAIVSGDRIAARFAIHAELRKGGVSNEVVMFAELAPDGRIRRTHQLTRSLSGSGEVAA
jgi:hypothetical protein